MTKYVKMFEDAPGSIDDGNVLKDMLMNTLTTIFNFNFIGTDNGLLKYQKNNFDIRHRQNGFNFLMLFHVYDILPLQSPLLA
jgi:hypothetical protein